MNLQGQILESIKHRNLKRANELIDELLKENPNAADAHYFKGVVHHFSGQLGAAADHLKKALALNPKHTDAAVCLSVLYNDIGKYDEAKSVFQVANQSISSRSNAFTSEIDRKFSAKHLELADLYFRYRRYDEAITEYTKAIQLDPQNMDPQIRRAKSYAKKGYVTRAIQELQRMRAAFQDSTEVSVQLGLLQYSQGNVLEAELEWEDVLKRDPTHAGAKEYLEMAKKTRISGPASPSTPHA